MTEEEVKIIDLYSSGLSIGQIRKKTGSKQWKIHKTIVNAGINRSIGDGLKLRGQTNLPKFDTTKFDIINLESAYYLGIIYSDGCICKTTHNRKTISLGSNDKDLIENFNVFVDNKNNIYSRILDNGKSHYRVGLCSSDMYDKLKDLGCVDRKSLVLDKPIIDPEFYYPFLLGLFDGDGCISLNRSINSWKASLCTGSPLMFEWLCKFFTEENLIYSEEIRKIKSGDFYIICFTGISAREFLNRCYDSIGDSFKTMERKYNKYLELRKVLFKRGPVFQKWELEIINGCGSNDNKANEINNDYRNYGWIRKADTIRRYLAGKPLNEQIVEYFESKEKQLEEVYNKCTIIPHKPDMVAIKQLLINCLEQHYGNLDNMIKKDDSAYITTLKQINELTNKVLY